MDDLTLKIPGVIVAEIEKLPIQLGDDQIEVEESYHDAKDIRDGLTKIQVYPMTRRKEGEKHLEIESIYYAAITRNCRPDDKERLTESIQFLLDLDEHFTALGSTISTPERVTFVQSEEENFLWFPQQLHRNNQFVALLQLAYKWKKTPQLYGSE